MRAYCLEIKMRRSLTCALIASSVYFGARDIPANGLECRMSRYCSLAPPVLIDEQTELWPVPLIARPEIARDAPVEIQLTITNPNWSIIDQGPTIMTLPVRLPPGMYPKSVPMHVPPELGKLAA
jgi:hypothetical protein